MHQDNSVKRDYIMGLTCFQWANSPNVHKEFRITTGSMARKSVIMEAISNVELYEDDISEILNAIKEREKQKEEKEREMQEEEKQLERKERKLNKKNVRRNLS